ncbi:hypothetical protein GCM10010166_61890 [Couchioplanes caeruleus subsp. azureus]|nr:hypothetical protein GCM10010166_61890 [Couchioplanes caeruleus subsp. azureus]
MADSVNSPGQVLSFPTGGGALRGIGDHFSADLHTGGGNLAVPISMASWPARGPTTPTAPIRWFRGTHGAARCTGIRVGVQADDRPPQPVRVYLLQYDDAARLALIHAMPTPPRPVSFTRPGSCRSRRRRAYVVDTGGRWSSRS